MRVEPGGVSVPRAGCRVSVHNYSLFVTLYTFCKVEAKRGLRPRCAHVLVGGEVK